ncbi:MAG: caspase family protein [Betaproteobacteria bacterium]|nr:caspase family protein [Betaproteobacteria bacterium]
MKELGFEVTLRENAGHGMQVKGRNYLVPTDADIQLEDEVPYSTIDVSLVLDKLEVGKSAVNIVILDACRNNPFARRFRSSGTGLAQMDAPIGTLIAFATAPGSVAQDGSGENGVYTKHLLESITMPGLPVEQMFKRVRVGVAKDTNEAQVPWESSSMKGDFVFRDAPPPQAVSQDKMIEEAVKAAAERAATLTAERMSREQTARQPQQDRSRAELEALTSEREKLLRERERLTAENEALRRKPAQTPETIALAAPTPAAQLPASTQKSAGSNRPEVEIAGPTATQTAMARPATIPCRRLPSRTTRSPTKCAWARHGMPARLRRAWNWSAAPSAACSCAKSRPIC